MYFFTLPAQCSSSSFTAPRVSSAHQSTPSRLSCLHPCQMPATHERHRHPVCQQPIMITCGRLSPAKISPAVSKRCHKAEYQYRRRDVAVAKASSCVKGRSCFGPVSLLRGPTGRSSLKAVQTTRFTATVCKRRKEAFGARLGDRLEDSPTVFTASSKTGRGRRLIKPLA